MMASAGPRVGSLSIRRVGRRRARGDQRERVAVDASSPAPACRGRRAPGTRARCPARVSSARPAASAARRRRARRRRPRRRDRGQRAVQRGRAARSSASAATLRLDSARPSGSRTVGQTSISHRDVEVARPAAGSRAPAARPSGRSRRRPGATMFSSLVTTVATPSKWPRPRCAPSSVSVTPATDDGGREPGRVDLVDGRREQEVDAGLARPAPRRAPRRAGRRAGRPAR